MKGLGPGVIAGTPARTLVVLFIPWNWPGCLQLLPEGIVAPIVGQRIAVGGGLL